jgi:uncharacterized protein YktA (UPF0223 family)
VFANPVRDEAPYIEDSFKVALNTSTGDINIFNANASSTNNWQDATYVVRDGIFVSLNNDVQPDYLSFANDIMSVKNAVSDFIPYDTIRLHFISGFTFSEFPPLLFRVSNQRNDGGRVDFCSVAINPDTSVSLLQFNPRPIFLTDAMYDKFVEIHIPSIKYINGDYYNTGLDQSLQLGASITPKIGGGYIGFVENAPINVYLHECKVSNDLLNTENNYTTYKTMVSNLMKELSVSQYNEWDGFGTYIGEAVDGDYIEFYAMFNGVFIDDLIGQLNGINPNDNWVIVHQLVVSELVNGDFLVTRTFMDMQEKFFDEPCVYRPVLKYAGIASAFAIDYTCRLLNKRDGNQVIRMGSYNSYNTKKYGKKMTTIPIEGEARSYKIYNKVIRSKADATRLFIDDGAVFDQSTNTSVKTVQSLVYVPVFFNLYNIAASNYGINTGSNEIVDNIFKQNDLRIVIKPFENAYKFRVYTTTSSGEYTPFNLSNSSDVTLQFTGSKGKIVVSHLGDSNRENLMEGEVIFVIPKDTSNSILDWCDRTMYISITTLASETSIDSVIYTMEWVPASEKNAADSYMATTLSTYSLSNNAASTTIEKPTGNNIPGYVSEVATKKQETSSVLKTQVAS